MLHCLNLAVLLRQKLVNQSAYCLVFPPSLPILTSRMKPSVQICLPVFLIVAKLPATGFPDASAATPAFSVVAKAPIPPEPPPFKLKVLLIGAGVCTERDLSLKLPLEVVCVIEIGDAIEHARKSFPNAQVLENLDSVIEQLKHNKLKLVPFDLVVSTLPCTDETRLKLLNNYSDTKLLLTNFE